LLRLLRLLCPVSPIDDRLCRLNFFASHGQEHMDEHSRPTPQNFVEDIAQTAALVRGASRIMVIGCSGGGKSTLSQQIAGCFDLRYISMDRDVLWLPGWVLRPRDAQRRLIAGFVSGDRWIVDGNNASSFDLRLPRSDLVIWVRMPRWLCLWGVLSRVTRWYGRTRADMAPDCPERFDWEFLRYVWNFERVSAPHISAQLVAWGPHIPVFQLKSRRQMRALLDILKRPA
jgi:adenylate kinase family enzyme